MPSRPVFGQSPNNTVWCLGNVLICSLALTPGAEEQNQHREACLEGGKVDLQIYIQSKIFRQAYIYTVRATLTHPVSQAQA